MRKETTGTTLLCRVPIPSFEHDILAVISQLVDIKLKFEPTNEGGGGALDLKASSFDAVTQKRRTLNTITDSLLGIVRYVTQYSDLYWDASGDSGQQAEVWIQTSEKILLPILRNQGGLKSLEIVKDFVAKIDDHLIQNDQTYLAGNWATAADIVVAISLVGVALDHFPTSLTFPDRVSHYVQTVLVDLESVVKGVDQMNWGKWKNIL
jgi:hypothetical protein